MKENVSKKIFIPIMALLILAGGTYGTTQALADEPLNNDLVVQKIAERFGLNEADVGSFFEDMGKHGNDWMNGHFEKKLDQLVADGEITEEQKQALLDKHAELQSEREILRKEWNSMTENERLAARDAHHDQMESWAEEMGIDLKDFRMGFGDKGMMDHGNLDGMMKM